MPLYGRSVCTGREPCCGIASLDRGRCERRRRRAGRVVVRGSGRGDPRTNASLGHSALGLATPHRAPTSGMFWDSGVHKDTRMPVQGIGTRARSRASLPTQQATRLPWTGPTPPEPILGAASGDPAHEPAGTRARSLPQDHSSRMETGFGSLSPLFTILPQTIYVRGPSPGSAMQDMPLTTQSQWMEECIRAFNVTASVSNRGLRNAATVDLITEALQKHLQSVESRSVSP